ncbi:MAG: YitT family protein [Oscillibacter sp.]|nr:YitT family protein [Oscillibacter sp.]
MMYNSLHHRWLRLLAAMLGEGVVALALNLFIVPLGLYTGGLMGFCQLIRTMLQENLGLRFGGADIAGILYFISNIPILFLGYKTLGRLMTFKTIACTVSFSFFYSVIPTPSTPIVEDYLTACLLGGILVGTASGIVLTCGGSGGGLDIVGLCLSKRGSRFTVGKFSLTVNFFLYAACLILFVPEVAIYSVIYNFFSAMVLDRMHQQNVNVQAMIFTKEDEKQLGRFIIEKLGRSVTYWEGTGAYSGKGLHVLVVCLSKFEIEELLHAVHEMDPHAFTTVQERVRVFGNFVRKLE